MTRGSLVVQLMHDKSTIKVRRKYESRDCVADCTFIKIWKVFLITTVAFKLWSWLQQPFEHLQFKNWSLQKRKVWRIREEGERKMAAGWKYRL